MALMNDTLLETSAVFVGPVGSEGGRSPSTLPIGQAVPPGGLAPGQRWSVGRKREVVLRLLRGESTESLSRELGVPSYRLERWRDAQKRALASGLTKVVAEVGKVPIKSVYIVIREGRGLHFMFGGEPVPEFKPAAGG